MGEAHLRLVERSWLRCSCFCSAGPARCAPAFGERHTTQARRYKIPGLQHLDGPARAATEHIEDQPCRGAREAGAETRQVGELATGGAGDDVTLAQAAARRAAAALDALDQHAARA